MSLLLIIFSVLVSSIVYTDKDEALDKYANDTININCSDVPITFYKLSDNWVCNLADECVFNYGYSFPKISEVLGVDMVKATYYSNLNDLPTLIEARDEVLPGIKVNVEVLCGGYLEGLKKDYYYELIIG